MDDSSEQPFAPGPAMSVPGHPPTQTLTISQNLELTGRHPVLIFGSSNAGKSTLILSLILGLQSMEDIAVSLGEPIFDESDPRAGPAHQRAKDTYDRGAYQLANGLPIGHTHGNSFFIPVDVKPKNAIHAPMKFAFLDGRGEQYQVEHNPDKDLYHRLAPEIIDVLENFHHGITIIYAAPFSVSDGKAMDTVDSSFGLAGALRNYEDHRVQKDRDSHLFLLTKWDQCAPYRDEDGPFANATAEAVNEVLERRYPEAWGTFRSLPLEGPALRRRAFMQYASGCYENGRYRQPDPLHRDVFRRYPRTVMNWLYRNALLHRRRPGEVLSSDQSLFEDVAILQDRFSLIDLLNRVLTAR